MKLNSTGERLMYLRELTRLSRNEFSKKYNLPEITLRRYEKGDLPISNKRRQQFIEIYKQEGLEITEGWLANGTGSPPQTISSISSIEMNQLINGEEKLIITIDYLKKLHPAMSIHMIQDNSMEPHYYIGDYVAGFPQRRGFKELDSLHCICFLENHEILIRKIVVNNDGAINLVSTNVNTKVSKPFICNARLQSASPIFIHLSNIDNKLYYKL